MLFQSRFYISSRVEYSLAVWVLFFPICDKRSVRRSFGGISHSEGTRKLDFIFRVESFFGIRNRPPRRNPESKIFPPSSLPPRPNVCPSSVESSCWNQESSVTASFQVFSRSQLSQVIFRSQLRGVAFEPCFFGVNWVKFFFRSQLRGSRVICWNLPNSSQPLHSSPVSTSVLRRLLYLVALSSRINQLVFFGSSYRGPAFDLDYCPRTSDLLPKATTLQPSIFPTDYNGQRTSLKFSFSGQSEGLHHSERVSSKSTSPQQFVLFGFGSYRPVP